MARNRINTERYAHLILWMLHDALANNKDKFASTPGIAVELSVHENLVELAANELTNSGLCRWGTEQDQYDDQVNVLLITTSGVNNVEEWEDIYEEEIKNSIISQHGPTVDSEVPASDRVVTITDNQQIEEVVAKLGEVISEFSEILPDDNEFGPAKTALLNSIEAGKSLIETAQFQINVITSLVLDPLKILAKKYESELIAGAIGLVIALLV